MHSRHHVAVIALFAAACGGGLLDISPAPDTSVSVPDASSDRDIAAPPDVGTPVRDVGIESDVSTVVDDDMGPPAMCDPTACGPGASCQNNVCTCDDGLLGDPFTGCSVVNPCEDVNCPAGSSCNPDGSCSCDPFFSGDAATGCVPTPPAADLSTRTAADVCAIWNDDYVRSSPNFWMIEPTDACDPGVMHPEEMRMALHETSRFRMLLGLYPVSLAAGALENMQDCAMMHEANHSGALRLDHFPPASWDCYTQAGYAGCGDANLAGGINQPTGTVSLYIDDGGTPSLGHRRWIFNPTMGVTAFGHRGRYGAMYAFDGSRNHNPDFVAYPAPGAFPRAAITGQWSIHGGANYSDSHTVTITNMGDGTDVPASNVNSPVFGNLSSTLAWTVSTNQLPVDTTYRITIRDGGGALVREYDTTLVTCP